MYVSKGGGYISIVCVKTCLNWGNMLCHENEFSYESEYELSIEKEYWVSKCSIYQGMITYDALVLRMLIVYLHHSFFCLFCFCLVTLLYVLYTFGTRTFCTSYTLLTCSTIFNVKALTWMCEATLFSTSSFSRCWKEPVRNRTTLWSLNVICNSILVWALSSTPISWRHDSFHVQNWFLVCL